MAKINIFRNVKKVERFDAGQTIFKEGEPGTLMYVVQSGEVDIFVQGMRLETVEEGGAIGEMAMIDTTARSATAVARTDCALVAIDETKFKTYVHHTPFFAIQVMKIMADRIRKMNEQL
ncbi:MAG: cyclic nucleotide-binding domain-containing protein [Chloroflexota bacterium]